MKAQYTIRHGNTAHVQVGSSDGYEKFDVPATPELVNHLTGAIERGETSNSFAGTSTQYAPVRVETKRRFVVTVVSEHVLREE